ncbi:MAG: type II secretion system GspH family protein [Planctomycetota bacterium]|nr:type II secretion system GspH family protein [Planctomycetota bacterium]
MTERGMTLVELLMVVAILAATAGMAFFVAENATRQSAYDETVARLAALKVAILGPEPAAAAGSLLIGGYLQDTGWLPDKPEDLWQPPEIAPGVTMPLLSYDPVWQTRYGWRGPYLESTWRRCGMTDGWGYNFYGWRGSGNSWWKSLNLGGDYAIRSPGADGKKDGEGGDTSDAYARDFPASSQALIAESEWVTVFRGGLLVKVINRTAFAYATAGSGGTPFRARFRFAIPRWDREPPLGYTDNLDRDPFTSAVFALDLAAAGDPEGRDQRAYNFTLASGEDLRVPNGRRMLFLTQVDGTPLPPINGKPVQACAEVVLARQISPPAAIWLEIRH